MSAIGLYRLFRGEPVRRRPHEVRLRLRRRLEVSELPLHVLAAHQQLHPPLHVIPPQRLRQLLVRAATGQRGVVLRCKSRES